MNKYSFYSFGHPSILGTHKNSLELNKDSTLTAEGNCIIGIRSDFSFSDLKAFLGYKKLAVELRVGNLKDTLFCVPNPSFNSNNELIIRTGDFKSERTFGILSTKSSFSLNRELVSRLADDSVKILVTIFPVELKLFIFDFDDTLEEFNSAKKYTDNYLSEKISEKYSVKKSEVCALFDEVDTEFTLLASKENEPEYYDRILWFKEIFTRLGLEVSDSEILAFVREYWDRINLKARLMPNAIKVLNYLSGKYTLILFSDSDGTKEIKLERLHKLNIAKYFADIITGDDLKAVKPSIEIYNYIINKYSVKAEECVVVGDKAFADLKTPKELGMTTVWIRKGKWADMLQKKPQEADYEIKDLIEIKNMW